MLGVVGLGVGGLAAGAALGNAVSAEPTTTPTTAADAGSLPAGGAAVEPFHGAHQAGIATPPQAHARFVALELRPGVDRPALVRLMRLLTDDVERLSGGRPALADPTPQLASVPARLTATLGFGMGLLRAAGLADQAPAWLAEGLPRFSIDRLQGRWSGGDLLLVVAADDPVTVSHAVQVLLTDAAPFATVRWVQTGFRRGPGTEAAGVTGRNLFGQVDGTVNPELGTDDFDQVVWVGRASGVPRWLVGGTAMVVRRIAMDLRTWGGVGTQAKEEAVGRRLVDGAPLTGGTERSAPDYAAQDAYGFPVIPATSHIRRAHAQHPEERILRRPFNYDDGLRADGSADAGLVFVACMADPDRQFVPIQRRLAQADVLNLWTTPIGSALFAVPPGPQPGEHLGQALLGS